MQFISMKFNIINSCVILSKDDTWHENIDYIIPSKASQKIYGMRKLKFMLDRDSLNKIYISFMRPTLEYANVVHVQAGQVSCWAPQNRY